MPPTWNGMEGHERLTTPTYSASDEQGHGVIIYRTGETRVKEMKGAVTLDAFFLLASLSLSLSRVT